MIYLARHGQTEFNRERRLQGHVDSPLTPLGVAQARALGRLLQDLTGGGSGWRIVASPLGRARRTAEIVAEALGVTAIEFDPRLMEVSWGEWDGQLRGDLETAFPQAFGASGWAFDAPTGETYEEACTRMSDWLTSLPPEPERRIIAVSHAVAGRVLRGVYGRLPAGVVPGLDVPQDAVYRMSEGRIERIDCEMAA